MSGQLYDSWCRSICSLELCGVVVFDFRVRRKERERREKRSRGSVLLLPLRQLENSHLVIFRSPAVLSKKVYSISRTYACAFSPIDPASFLSCV